METTDPLTSLASNRISERAAAGRDLSKVGTLDLVPRLVDQAQSDPSPAVRLTLASAAADILSRHRIGLAAAQLSAAQRRELAARIRGVDPGVNAGLFSMLAALGTPESFQQIAVGLRDPRGGVRVGAAVGLMRLCMSAAAHGDAELERCVVAMLEDRRLKPDALAEVARVCGAVGYRSARRPMAELVLPGVHGDAVSTALDVLAAAGAPLSGAWLSDGRDAGEVSRAPALPPALWLVSDSGAVEAGPEGWIPQTVNPTAARRMYIRRVGEADPAPALQLGGRTFYRASEADLLDELDRATRAEQLDGDALPAEDTASPEDKLAAAALAGELVDGGPALRARGLLLARAGRREEALEALEAATQAKRAPADTWFLLGELYHALGRSAEAHVAWEAYLKREKRKRAPQLERAQARLTS